MNIKKQQLQAVLDSIAMLRKLAETLALEIADPEALKDFPSNLSVRAMNILKWHGINNPQELITSELTIEDLKHTRNCGMRTIQEIQEYLKTTFGIRLK